MWLSTARLAASPPRLRQGEAHTVRRDIAVEVKIGVQHAPREIVLESGQTADEIERSVAEALTGKSQLLSLVDENGRRVVVPADRLAYVDIGEPSTRKVGFGAL
ncbi:DUF3107 domain-containing protein [Streptomyces carminius]|uniref:DUF3107 domain-containing protein n=1 Tax=Streptomyces carminius TaxID=2665496 RepID=A0A2M8LW39_9ACTN|nr:DUF3107 domain-containing protein [Streptomyces carminius]